MGRHRTAQEKHELGERARQLRAEGRSRREIQAELGIGDELAKQLLSGTEVPDSLRRPRAKDELRREAARLHAAGLSYNGIAAELGVSKSSLSLWLRGAEQSAMPAAEEQPSTSPGTAGVQAAARRLRAEGLLLKEIGEELGVSVRSVSRWTEGLPWPARSKHGGDAEHVRAMAEARWADHRRQRDIAVQQRKLAAARAVGEVPDQSLLLLGAMAYWCEGSKSKPWRRQGKFTFINSDPVIMRIMVRWLRLLAIPPERWVVRIQIHETADLAAAEEHWRHVLGLPELVFAKETIKRHKPRTVRKNVGDGYHGCVSIYVRNGAELLQQVEGWMIGLLLGVGGTLPAEPMLWSDVEERDARLR